MHKKKPKLAHFNTAAFLKAHWQKKPLFIPSALPADFLTMRPASLFALAAREHVESRLIERQQIKSRWMYSLTDGPIAATELKTYGAKKNWTLLVQRANEWLPAADLLFEYFNFIPNWRTDDIMISYAAPGGTVGPHLDNYDVFLCQLKGERTWELSSKPTPEILEKNQPVRLLTNFKADQKIIARPGDVLYVPPRVAHYGVANTESITVSVGFRAPQVSRLMEIAFEQAAPIFSEVFYSDKGTKASKQPGAIGAAELKKLTKLARLGLNRIGKDKNTGTLYDAILRDLSMTPNAQISTRKCKLSLSEFKSKWMRHPLQRNPRNQYFYRVAEKSVTLCTAGESMEYPKSLLSSVQCLCNQRVLIYTAIRQQSKNLEFWYRAHELGLVFFQK